MAGLSNGSGLSQSPGLTDGASGLWSGASGLAAPDGGPASSAILMQTTGFVLMETGSYILLE